MKEADDYLESIGLVWKQNDSNDEPRFKLEGSYFQRFYENHTAKEETKIVRIREGLRFFGNLMMVDKYKFFQAIGFPEQADEFPLELLDQCIFNYKNEKEDCDFYWDVSLEKLKQQTEFAKKWNKSFKVQSLFALDQAVNNLEETLQGEMVTWMIYFFDKDLTILIEKNLIPILLQKIN